MRGYIFIPKRKAYYPRITEVKFIGSGTDEDTTRVLQAIIFNHLEKEGLIDTKHINGSKLIYELQK